MVNVEVSWFERADRRGSFQIADATLLTFLKLNFPSPSRQHRSERCRPAVHFPFHLLR
jgi:hypothetical protein